VGTKGERDLTYFFAAGLVRRYKIVVAEVVTKDESVGRILTNISYEIY